MPANLENSAVATGLEKVSFHSNPKERKCQRVLKLLPNCTRLTHSSELNSTIPVHFSLLILECRCHSCHLLFDHFQFAFIHGPNIPGSYAILLFTALDLASITSHIHNWVLFLLWLHPFILSGVISPLISSNILDTYQPGEFIFQCPIFLPFPTVYGVLKARILKWFAIPFSSEPHFVRRLHHDRLSWVAPHDMA